jgi:tetratricopeptide (TPR) repeat protein
VEIGPAGSPGELLPIADLIGLAGQLRASGRLPEAESACRRVLAVAPESAEALHILGLIAHQTGRLGDAIGHLHQAASVAPDVALYHANLGEMYRLAGQIEQAIAEGRRAVALRPDYTEALNNLGAALYDGGDYAEAAACQRRAIEANPDFAQAHSGLGNALHALKQFDEAAAAYRRAIALAPDFADAWANLGTTLHHAGAFDEAMVALRRAIALAPDHANAHSGLGILLLTQGEFGEGLEEYEWRLRSDKTKGLPFPNTPWRGESLAGRHIHVEAEQGFGDTLQFARYLPLLVARGGRVSFRTHQDLLTLMRASLPDIDVFADHGSPAQAADCECALLSLPRLLKTRIETIPAAIPYLRTPAETAERWQARLANLGGIRVGLVWAGNPAHVNDFRRSFDLAMLAPLLGLSGVSFVSLQVGPRAKDLHHIDGPAIPDLSPELRSFADSAAAISALDLVIAVDTAVAHLAGGLGKPVWMLLPWVSDWRWLTSREDSPWYPTMRLFRQRTDGDRGEVIARVARELAAVAAGDGARLAPFRAAGERRAALAAEIIAAEAVRVATPAKAAVLPPPGQALVLAEQHRHAGRLGKAEELCRDVLNSAPSAEAAHLLGIIAHQAGRPVEAIEHIRRAIALDGSVALYHANLGEMCRLAGRTGEAVTHARRALALSPDHVGAMSNLGIALYEQRKYSEALRCQDRAIARRPDFVQAHSNRGNVLRALERREEAEAAYRRAIELAPNFAEAWNNLGTVLRELKRPKEAETAYHEALALRPNDPEILDNLGLALRDLGRLDEAVQMLRHALTVLPGSATIRLHLNAVLASHRIEKNGKA